MQSFFSFAGEAPLRSSFTAIVRFSVGVGRIGQKMFRSVSPVDRMVRLSMEIDGDRSGFLQEWAVLVRIPTRDRGISQIFFRSGWIGVILE